MPVIYISPSMTGEKIVKRLLSIVCRIPLEHIVSGMLSVEEWENLERGSAALRDSPIYIFDTPGISIDKLEEQVQMFCKQNKAKAVLLITCNSSNQRAILTGPGTMKSRMLSAVLNLWP